jgi:hypothetical protein
MESLKPEMREALAERTRIARALIAEVAGVRWVRGLSVRDYLAGLDRVALGIFVLMLLLFAAMPMLVKRPPTWQQRARR